MINQINNLNFFLKKTNTYQKGTFILIFILLIITLSLLIYNLFYYKKHNLKFFTTKKIVIISMFFAIFLLQSIFTGIQSSDSILLISFDSASIIIVSFIFGPIEGFIYALLADNIRVLLINQWLWQPLYAFQYPLMALVAGMIGRKWNNHQKNYLDHTSFENHRFLYFFLAQGIFIFIFLFSTLIAYFNPTYIENEDLVFNVIVYYSLGFIVIYEFIYTILLVKKKYVQIELLTILLIIAVINRYLIVMVPASFADVNSGWRPSIGSAIIPRVFKSAYLIPSSVLVWYFLISIYKNVEQKTKLNEW